MVGLLRQNVYSLISSGCNIFAGTNYGVYITTNSGLCWSAVNEGLTNRHDLILSLTVSGTNLFAGTWIDGVFLSTNNGSNWSAVNNGLINLFSRALESSGTNIFSGFDGSGVFLSTNNSASWTSVNNGTNNNFRYVNFLKASGQNLFAGTEGGLFLSTNNGSNWTLLNNGLDTSWILSLTSMGTNIFVGAGKGIYLSTNNGTSWTLVNTELGNQYIQSLAVSGTILFAGTEDGGIYLSTNNGVNWVNKNQGFDTIPSVRSLLISNGYIFAGTDGRSVWRRSLSEITNTQNISAETPSKFSLNQNYPNPFNPTTKIRYEIPVKLSYPNAPVGNRIVILKVFDALGREVETLVNEKQSPGIYEVTFTASRYPSGVYFYRLSLDNVQYGIRKMMLIR